MSAIICIFWVSTLKFKVQLALPQKKLKRKNYQGSKTLKSLTLFALVREYLCRWICGMFVSCPRFKKEEQENQDNFKNILSKTPFFKDFKYEKKSKNNSKKSRNSSASGHPELSKSVTSPQSKSPVWGFNEIKGFSLSKYFVV